MKTNHHSNPSRLLGFITAVLATANFLWMTPSPMQAQTQTYPCETVMQFGTGMSSGGAKLRPGSVDPFFDGTSANFPDRGTAYVVTDEPAAWLDNASSADSQWIGPSPSVADDVAGTYVYRLQFTTPCAGARVTGRYAAGDRGALRLNGAAAVSFTTPAIGYNVWTAFSFANLPAGANTIEFYVTNSPTAVGPPGPTGLRAELTVTATCCPCIVLTCPSDIFLTTCSTGATANFSITGTNRCYTNLTINCSLNVAGANIPVTPNTVFPPGTNNVFCDASDTAGHRTNCSFRLVVTRDTRPPEIDCPRPIVYLCRGGGTNIFYNVTATDDTDPNPVVTCVPPSGSFFPPGTNTVTCEARDACGRISKCSFPVIISPNGFVKTLQAGIADNFSLGAFEPATPGPCLPASGFWNGLPFDTSWPGRQMSHSFQGLPLNIVAAKLTLHMRPMQPASQDDVLRLGLQNCGAPGVWAFSQDVASLPGAGGTWNANPPTTFTLDLAALPGGLNLLADLNATHRLEFAVGTETMVDYAQLEVTYCGPATTLSGVPYSLNNAYPIHQGGSGVSWRTVNSNGPPPTVEIDISGADGFRFDIAQVDPGIFSFCQFGSPISQHHGLATDWPTGEGTIATLGINAAAAAGQTRISMSQPSNVTGKSVEVWNAGQLVSRYFLAGTADTAVNVPSSACLVQMGFLTGYFFAAFESAVPINIVSGGQHVSGQVGPVVNGTSVRLSYVITVNAGGSKLVRATLPIGGIGISKMSLLRDADWIEPYGPQQISVSDVMVSKALVDTLLNPHPYGDCSPAYGPWTLDLNGAAGFCTFDGGNPPQCNDGYVDVNITGPGNAGTTLNFGGLRLTPAALPLDDCHIQCTVAGGTATPYSLTINRMVGGPITLNNVSAADFSSWPLSVTGNAGPQSFGVVLAANTMVTVGAQTYTANGATFHASPQFLGEFYQVCLETTFQSQMSFKSYHTIGGPPIAPDCLTLSCPTNVIVNCTNENGTVVTFNPTGATRCGSNVVITCVPPSGSVFQPGTSVVLCRAIDSQGNQDQCRFLVTVRDVTAPTLLIPARVIVPCDGPQGAIVEFAGDAADNCDPSPVTRCTPPSGSVFPVGTNYVACTSIDAAGNRSANEFPVIVTGGCGTNRCLEITVPADIEVPCGPASARVIFTVTGRNSCTGGALTPVCVPPSGSAFAIGETRVVCTVTSGGSQAAATFIVEVTDTVPPEITCPRDISAAAQSPLGAIITYAASGRDDCAPQVRLRCSPPSGSVFPVGETKVLCEATDGHGNSSVCVFTVIVAPPTPLRTKLLANRRVELRWTGNAIVEMTEALSDETIWRILQATPETDGLERVLVLAPSARQSFFRTQPLPLLPDGDADGDGVLDSRDRCPNTPPGLLVDAHGCALFDLIATPENAIGPERKLATETVQRMRFNRHFDDLVTRLDPMLVNSNSPSIPLNGRQMPRALTIESNLVRQLRATLADFQRMRPAILAEVENAQPHFGAEHADARELDMVLLELEDIESGLTDSLKLTENTLAGLSNIVRAITGQPSRGRATISSLDSGRGAVRLTDGRILLLPDSGSPAAPPLNQIPGAFAAATELDLQTHPLPDGSHIAVTLEPSENVSPNIPAQANPRRMQLRVVPANPSLPDWDTGVRHHLKAYKWGFTSDTGYHFLEYGMAFAAIRTINLNQPGGYKHWLKVLFDVNNDGYFGTLISNLDENSPPFVLKASQLPEFSPFNIMIREFRAPILPNGTTGTPEVLGEETYTIELYQPGYFAEADYSRTRFELPDNPNTTAFQSAQVIDIIRNFPLTMQPLNQQSFQAASYKVSGNSSSYPSVQTIYPGQSFAVHFRDPNADLFFAFPEDLGRGLYSPSVRGVRNGKPFQYKTALPMIVRDRVHDCTTDSYYRIPFLGPIGAGLFLPWHVSQGNNGEFTHNGTQRYAFDFPKSSGTQILAARGGIVTKVRESGVFSCWDPDANDGDGDCVNCEGVKAGNVVRILHQDGTTGVYVHFKFNGVIVAEGQRVYRGDPIGYVGSTGCSTGPHLHFHVLNPEANDTIPIRFETYDDDFDFRECYLPGHDSDGFSTNKPYWWPF